MRIMAVDDREEERYLLETLLKASGYEVETAADGAEALEKLRAADFDMIVSDILMPVMDGFRFCRECKGDEKLKDIPFVFYTATYKDEKDEELASKLGADKYIRKPIEPEEFIKIIQGIVGEVEAGRAVPKKPAVGAEKEVFKLYSERLVKKLEKKMLNLEAEITERKRAEERLEHLNMVLYAIRKVNQLVTMERDRDRLIKGACQNLIKTRGYYHAWLTLLDESGGLVTADQAGFGKEFLPIVELLKQGRLTDCVQKALRQSGVVVIKDPLSTCTGCPCSKILIARGAMATRLERGEKVFGVLVVSIPAKLVEDEEEQSLFQEVAGDIALGLHAIEEEAERKRAEEGLRDSGERFRALIENSSDITQIVDSEGVIRYISPSVQRVLGYRPEELIGRLSIDVVHPDDLQEVAKGFEKAVQGPGVPVITECRCKHKDGTWRIVRGIGVNCLDNPSIKGFIANMHDITERKEAEEALRVSEEKYRTFFETSRDAVFITSKDGGWIDFNDATVELFGYKSREGLRKTSTQDVYKNPEERESIIQKIERQGYIKDYAVDFRKKDGSIINTLITFAAIKDENGNYIGQQGTIKDITERKQMEEELRKNRAQLQILLDSSPDAIRQVDRNLKIVWANKAALTRNPDAIGQPCYKAYALRDEPCEVCPTIKAMETGQVETGVVYRPVAVATQGESYWEAIGAPLKESDGTIIGAIQILRNVTERKRAEEALRASEEKYRRLAENVTDVIFVQDMNLNMTYVSSSAQPLFGYSVEEALNLEMKDIMTPDSLTKAVDSFQNNVASAKEKKDIEIPPMEYEYVRKDGSTFWGEIRVTFLRDSEGCPVGVQGVLRDITERKRAEEKALELETLRELDRMRAQLLSNVSHELRTPLTSIKGFASTLLRIDVKWSEEEQRDFLQAIDTESDRLTRLISDLLDMSRIEAGALKLEKGDYRVSEIMGSIGYKLAIIAEHHQLQVIAPAELPTVFVDEMRIGQVVTNLVENATKYSGESSPITIEAQLADDHVIISVTDRGQGMAPELLDRVFDRFYQTESIVTGRKTGTGLGLSICRGIIETHGGRIWVDSKVGEGSKFSFSLPVSKGGKEVA